MPSSMDLDIDSHCDRQLWLAYQSAEPGRILHLLNRPFAGSTSALATDRLYSRLGGQMICSPSPASTNQCHRYHGTDSFAMRAQLRVARRCSSYQRRLDRGAGVGDEEGDPETAQ